MCAVSGQSALPAGDADGTFPRMFRCAVVQLQPRAPVGPRREVSVPEDHCRLNAYSLGFMRPACSLWTPETTAGAFLVVDSVFDKCRAHCQLARRKERKTCMLSSAGCCHVSKSPLSHCRGLSMRRVSKVSQMAASERKATVCSASAIVEHTTVR